MCEAYTHAYTDTLDMPDTLQLYPLHSFFSSQTHVFNLTLILQSVLTRSGLKIAKVKKKTYTIPYFCSRLINSCESWRDSEELACRPSGPREPADSRPLRSPLTRSDRDGWPHLNDLYKSRDDSVCQPADVFMCLHGEVFVCITVCPCLICRRPYKHKKLMSNSCWYLSKLTCFVILSTIQLPGRGQTVSYP